MRILVIAPGSTGDVTPLLGLGHRLHDDGHQVAVAAHEPFREQVTAAGLELRPIAGDPQQLGETAEGRRWQDAGSGPVAAARMARLFRDYVDGMSQDLLAAARDGIDAVLVNAVGVFTGYHVAEGLGLPGAGVFPAPLHATGEFPPASLGLPNLGPRLNRAAGRAVLSASSASFRRTTTDLRTQLGLAPMRGSLWRHLDDRRWPVLYGFSTAVLPRPADWRSGIEVTGYWWPPVAPQWRPPPELAAFLDDGPPPVYFGLGSRSVGDPARIGSTIHGALRRTGLRAVVQSGWAGFSVADDDVLTVDEVPHEWLFPRMAAVAHHCGAGTTAAGLRAGVPTVGLPVLADQPFWAARMAAVGAGPPPIRIARLTTDRLADALRAAVEDDRYRARAQQLSQLIRAEDGVGSAAAAIHRRLSL